MLPFAYGEEDRRAADEPYHGTGGTVWSVRFTDVRWLSPPERLWKTAVFDVFAREMFEHADRKCTSGASAELVR
jgi:hypothetical protein